MATQVKFHNTTAEAYGSATKTDGGLYFISDNGEIRKGDSHITGTRVYSATDTTGKTALGALDIKLGETSISTEGFTEKPKKGDVLIVSHELTTGKYEYSAYVYATNGGTYNANGWQACDGNVDASKVILTSDITMAGNYDKIGNFTKDTSGKKINFIDNDTKGTAGVSVYELIKQMLSKTIEPTWQRNPPTASLNSSTSSSPVEVGTTVTATFTASLNDAYAKFTGGDNQMAGCPVDTSENKGYHFDGAETGKAENTTQKNWVAGVDTAPSATVTIDYKASTNAITNNLGDTTFAAGAVSAGTTTQVSKTASVTAYRNWFSGVDTDGTETIDSAFIRNLTKEGSATANDNHQFIVGSGAKRIVVAIPKSSALAGAKTLKNVFLVSASNTPLEISPTTTTGYKKLENAVSVADAREDKGYINYDVWVYQPASISPTEEHNIVIG